MRVPHAFIITPKGGRKAAFYLPKPSHSPAPTGAAPSRQRREFASIGQRYLCPTCRENPAPNAAFGREKGGITAKKYEICLRLNQAEAERLYQDSRRCGLSKTAYLRQLIMGAEIKARPSEEIKKLRTEIHHIGNNVNQIARKINAGFGSKEDAAQIKYLLGEIYRLMYEIAKE